MKFPVAGISISLLSVFLLRFSPATHLYASGETDRNPIPSGDIRGARGFYSIVFYFAPKPAADTLVTARTLTNKFLPSVAFCSDPDNVPKIPYVGFEEEQTPLKKYPVPDKDYFKYAGRGLTDKDIEAFQGTSQATRLVLVVSKDDVWTLGRKFTELAQEFAATTQGYVWDSSTRECFSLEAWKEKRLVPWPETGIPDISRQITIHLYRPDDHSPYMRAITLGMEKFALPDVVVERTTGSDYRPTGNLINLVCQSLAERPVIKDGKKESFSLEQLKSEVLRARMESSLDKDATMRIVLALLPGHAQEGDANNRLIEIGFQNGSGNTEDEKREDLLSKLWGAHDSMISVKHTGEILEASKRAKSKLPELRTAFEKGLPSGSRLLVKAPFTRDDNGGNEWMWVEVMKWSTDADLEGVLQNDPFYVSSLKAGAKVSVHVADIFDYILDHGDGTREGNETGKLIEEQGGPVKTK